MQELISISEAQHRIQAQVPTSQTEAINLPEAHLRVLREDLIADRPIPPFDRVMMDGVAIDSQEFFGIGTELRLAGTQAAGAPALEKLLPNTCFEVMTGATLPVGCDCVIPVEQLSITGDSVIFSPDTDAKAGQFIHREGSDSQQGDTLLTSPQVLNASKLAVAASIGKTQLQVSLLPIIHLITSGDEVIDPADSPASYQIRRSHPSALLAMITGQKLGQCQHTHIPDNQEETERIITDALESADILIFTGGVSKGKFDFIAPTLSKLVGAPHFHGVKQRPGKPFGFWKTENSPAIFGLPGNPVSVTATATRYLLPTLRQYLGLPETQLTRTLAKDLIWKAPLPGLVAVKTNDDGRVEPQLTNNSGDYLAIADADGFIEIPQSPLPTKAGTAVPYFPCA